jgi:hypothetical protein
MIDVFEIREKRKANPLAAASPEDFASSKVAEVDASVIIADPTISLYCVDHVARQAWFVQVPEGSDITAAPFMYQAQYDHAKRLLAVPYDLFHHIAADMTLRDPLVFIHSTGRAGSTLMSKAFAELGAVTSLSEPDVFTQALALRSAGVPDNEIRDLLTSATRILFNHAFTRGSRLNVVKFRGLCIELGDLLFASFPESGNLFVYRDLAPFLRSWARAFSLEDLPTRDRRDFIEFFAQLMPILAEELRHRAEIAGIELWCLVWLSIMHAYVRLTGTGLPMLAVRYEELVADPPRVFGTILTYLGLPGDWVQRAFGAFDRDSQAGSPLSREEAARRRATVDDHQWELVRDLVGRYPFACGDISSKSFEVP